VGFRRNLVVALSIPTTERRAVADIIKVLFVDDDTGLSKSWERLIRAQADMECVEAQPTADRLIEAARRTQASVVMS
jgi:hypothetical protein